MGQVEADLQAMPGLGGADGVLVFTYRHGTPGHPVAVAGLLRPSAGCGLLFRSLGVVRLHPPVPALKRRYDGVFTCQFRVADENFPYLKSATRQG